MKKSIALLLALCLLLSMAACGGADQADLGKQTATAYLNQSEETPVAVTVDLSGGWSVEFARGALYLYDKEIQEDTPSTAMLMALDREVYEEYVAAAEEDENRKEADGGVYFSYYEDEAAFITSLEDAAFILITTPNKDDIASIVSRFSFELNP